MRRSYLWWGLCAVLSACGSRSLPSGPEIPESPAPLEPDPDGGTLPPTSLWPLSTGSRWTYRITDPSRSPVPFDKVVQVLGMQAVPDGAGAQAIAVQSTQPHLEELSWQYESDGIVVRVREEDRQAGALARVTTWVPGTVKSLAQSRDAGWSYSSTTLETVKQVQTRSEEQKQKTYVWRVVAVDETVTVPAGTFHNVLRLERARADKDSTPRTYWLVPGVGKIREDGERLEELVEADIKP